MENRFDVIVIGGGIVGLATALRIMQTRPGLSLALLEKETALAQHQTGNNSGVIHAGLYYKPGSLKAVHCLTGYRMLIDFCTTENIPFELCGKLVVASRKEDLPALNNLYERGMMNGLKQIVQVPSESIPDYESAVKGLAALWVPYTGIVDYTQVCRRFAELLQNKFGASIHTSTRAIQIKPEAGGSHIETNQGTFTAKLLINTAGLHSDRVARMEIPDLDVRIIPFRGEYYSLRPEARKLVNNLVYPVPDPSFPFLGVHFTRRINGEVEAGPNAVFAFAREAYSWSVFSLHDTLESFGWKGFRKVMRKYWQTGLGEYYRSFSKPGFTRALQKLVPSLEESQLLPGGAGIRAQACTSDGYLADDFLIRETSHSIHVLNAPSPAATASLAIGETLALKALQKLQSMP